ncbi:MAG: tRNA lysidine(34) synthetase TilS [Planctomycetes bacterium]|nr:tRNA lysidine(34) synthetase TilS [Planctomycetota bacterium]
MSESSPLEKSFASAMREILDAAGKPKLLLAGVSGGMDSVVLCRLLARWRASAAAPEPPPRLVLAHFNHRLRGDAADEDAAFCRRLAARRNLDMIEDAADVAAYAEENGMGLEEAGRALRYNFFRRNLGRWGGLALTGHHADDQAETILLHLRRGAHRRGLSGMKPYSLVAVPPGVQVPIGRPLLRMTRDQLHEYAQEHRLAWREDESNQDESFMRNRIRRRVIPMLESILPGFRTRLLEKAELMAKEEDELVRKGRVLAECLTRREHGGRAFLLTPEALSWPERLNYALRHIVEEEMGGRLPYGAALASLTKLAETARLGETVCLPGKLRVRRESDGLFFFFPDQGGIEPECECLLPDPPFAIKANRLRITAAWATCDGMPPADDMADANVEWFNPQALRWPLRIRPPLAGERFRALGAPGSKKIQDILMDAKTPRRQRMMARVLADHAGAIWIWPYRIANRVRLASGSDKALRVEIRPES